MPSRDGIGHGGERLGRLSDNRLSEILLLCQKANTADVMPPRPFASRPLAANCCGVDGSGLDPERPHGVALWKVGACVSILVKNVRYSVGRSRRLAPVGRNIPSEDTRRWFRPRPDAIPGLIAGAPSRRASWPMALCTHPPLRRER